MQTWTERRFLIQSISGLQAAMQGLRERINKSEQAIQDISVIKQGKMHLKTREEVDKAIQEALKKFQVQGILAVTIHEDYQEKKVQVSQGKIAEPHREVYFTLSTE